MRVFGKQSLNGIKTSRIQLCYPITSELSVYEYLVFSKREFGAAECLKRYGVFG